MKQTHSITTGKVFHRGGYYEVDEKIGKDFVNQGLAYRLKKWKIGAVDYKQYVNYV